MIQALQNALRLPDLRKRIFVTIGILILFRFAAHVPVPGVNIVGLRQIFENNQLLGMLDLFTGGALSNFSVMAMGVYPYITASIILNLLQPIIPKLSEIAKEGDAGRQKMTQYTYWLTIPMAALNAFGQSSLLASSNPGGVSVLSNFSLTEYPLQTVATIFTLTAGTMFAVWLGELITEQGIGQGISIIIFGGIVAQIPQRVGQLIIGNPTSLIFFVLLTVVTVAVIVMVNEGQRRIPVQYGRRVRAMRGNRLMMVGGQATHVPLRVNSAGMIPLIFAQSILLFPGTIAGYFVYSQTELVARLAVGAQNFFSPQGNWYWAFYFVMVVGFTYFYTDVMFRQQNLSESLQKQGGFIPGIRPGKRTESYLNGVLMRITLVGAVFLGLVAVLPGLVRGVTDTSAMLITSAGLLIVVGVVLDTMKQLEAQLLMRHYEGFIR